MPHGGKARSRNRSNISQPKDADRQTHPFTPSRLGVAACRQALPRYELPL
jgi:hypothetical protein